MAREGLWHQLRIGQVRKRVTAVEWVVASGLWALMASV